MIIAWSSLVAPKRGTAFPEGKAALFFVYSLSHGAAQAAAVRMEPPPRTRARVAEEAQQQVDKANACEET